MSGKGGGGQGGTGTDDMAIVAAVIVAAIVIWLIWTKARSAVVWAAYGPDYVQYWVLDHIGLLKDEQGRKFYRWVAGCLAGKVDMMTVDWDILSRTRIDAGMRTRWLYVLASFGLAVLVALKMHGSGFRRIFSLTGEENKKIFRVGGMRIDNKLAKWVIRLLLTITFTKKMLLVEKREWVPKNMSFARYQAEHWRVFLTGAMFDPNTAGAAEGPQLTPMEWMRENKVALTKRDGLDEVAAEEVFERQLGPMWLGVEKAEVHVQAICVLAALNVKRDKDALQRVRDRLTEIYVLTKDAAKAAQATKDLIAPFLKDKKIVAAINRHASNHAYANTAMTAVYGWGGPIKSWGGGEAGVLATAMFRWLKRVDRTMFYCLNNVGRRRFHIEGSGALSHYFAEKVIGTALAQPTVGTAVDGLADYLDQQGVYDLEEYFRVDKDF